MAVKIIIICLFDRWFYSSLWPFSGFCLLEDKNDSCRKLEIFGFMQGQNAFHAA